MLTKNLIKGLGMRFALTFAGACVCLGMLLNSFALFNQSLFLSINSLFPVMALWPGVFFMW
jgi:hypothetical protein